MKAWFLRALLVSAFLVIGQAQAAYIRTGQVTGHVCSGFVIEYCGFEKIDAVRNSQGEIFHVAETYESVSDYSASQGRCWVRLDGGILWFMKYFREAEFLQKTNGGYRKIDPETISFACRKT